MKFVLQIRKLRIFRDFAMRLQNHNIQLCIETRYENGIIQGVRQIIFNQKKNVNLQAVDLALTQHFIYNFLHA